jgi:hypothetical protein
MHYAVGKMLSLQAIDQEVSQDEIEEIIGLRNQIRKLRNMQRKRAVRIFQRLLAGAKVEQGIHCAEIVEKSTGCVRVTRLEIY